MWNWITSRFAELHAWTFEALVQPVLYRFGFMNWDEQAFEATELFLIGLIEVLLLYAIFRPIEAWAPVEKWDDRSEAHVDIYYSLLSKLGLIPLFFFLLLTPAFDWINGTLRMSGVIPPNLEDMVPALQSSAALSAVTYLLILDFFDYWRHRFQHRFSTWWQLHALHHSQRQMTFWTDSREHLIDQMISAVWRAGLSLLIGVPPVQFLTITLISGAIESFSHANVRVKFGSIGRYILVSPHFHRIHHAMAFGYDGPAKGCNFAQVFAFWDVMFGTATFAEEFPSTGISDQTTGRDYGRGYWSQQWLGVRRLLGADGK